MADLTIIATEDTYLDGNAQDDVRSAIDNIQISAGTTAVSRNPVWQFDISDLSGKAWDSAVLKVTWKANGAGLATETFYLAYIKIAATEIDDCTWNSYDDSGALTWASAGGAAGAEDSVSNDHDSRKEWDLSAAIVADTTISSPDLTDVIDAALLATGSTLNLICYGSGVQSSVRRFKSLETTAISTEESPQLLISGIRAATVPVDPGSGVATNVPVGSVAVSTKSQRPPVQEPGRQATASIFHNGVEPMNILALIVKGAYGTNA